MIKSAYFGTTAEGREVRAHTIVNNRGAELTVLDYGATIQSLKIPGRDGTLCDVVLGYDSVSGYEQGDGYIGATIGRVGNRIAKGKFSLNGIDYQLNINDGDNHLHGGNRGFDKRVWSCREGEGELCFSYISPDGEENYPGNLSVKVHFSLDESNALHIRYEAETDKACPVNLTNHAYFNLAGHGDIHSHLLQLNADYYLEGDGGCLPTGNILPVDGAFDFRELKAIGRDIACGHEQLVKAGGYDHNYVLNSSRAAEVRCEESGIVMTVDTDRPGVQLYTGNFLTERAGKNGSLINKRSALCLETQVFPDAINNPHFGSAVLKAGEKLETETVYGFGVM